ncbi:MAG: hypothetical protein HY688_04060 [Chloroflexi bacterium]|nr:hypothetical protein [Chloroflexota bacterium]
MVARQPSPYALEPSEGARRYFSQFLGQAARWSPRELAYLRVIEAQGPEDLLQTGERAYRGVRLLQSRLVGTGHHGHEEAVVLFPDQTPLALPDLLTAVYVALVNAVARELGVEPPTEVRGLPMAEEMPGLPSNHLALVGRFSMDAMRGLREETLFHGLMAIAIDRLESLAELAAQSMVDSDVDPFETFEHADCEACGHLLQRHVGFESWDDVRAEHRQWCPGARAR